MGQPRVFLGYQLIRHMWQIQRVNVALQELQFPEFPLYTALGWGEPQKMFHTRFGRWKEQQYSVYAWDGTKCCIPGELLSICWHFFKNIYILNWRLTALQCCGGFCRTSTWISPGCTWLRVTFPSCGEWGLLSRCSMWASHRGGFSFQSPGSRACGNQQLWPPGTRAPAQ